MSNYVGLFIFLLGIFMGCLIQESWRDAVEQFKSDYDQAKKDKGK